MNPAGLIPVAIGLFTFAAGLFIWDWFVRSKRMRILMNYVGPQGARIIYMILGIILVVIGVALL